MRQQHELAAVEAEASCQAWDIRRRTQTEPDHRDGTLRSAALLAWAVSTTPLWIELAERGALAAPADDPLLDRRILAAAGTRSLADRRLNPDLLQRHLARRPEAFLFGQYQVFRSQGAPNRQLHVVHDWAMWCAYGASLLRAMRRARADLSGRVALVGSADPRHTLPRAAHMLRESSTLVVGMQDGLRAMVDDLNAWRPATLLGYSSVLRLLADEQLGGRLHIGPTAVVSGTDALLDDDRAAINRAWGVRPCSYYATTETGVIASGCPDGDGLHVNHDLVRLTPAVAGTLADNLLNRVQPVLRYRLPDPLVFLPGDCPCGEVTSRIALPTGRRHPVAWLPDPCGGRTPVHAVVLRSALDDLPIDFETEVRGDGVLEVTIVGDAEERLVVDRLRAALARIDRGLEDIPVGVVVRPAGAGGRG